MRYQILSSVAFVKPDHINVYVIPPDSVEAVLEAVRRRFGPFEVVYSQNNYFKLVGKRRSHEQPRG
jgi:hypothetical protein